MCFYYFIIPTTGNLTQEQIFNTLPYGSTIVQLTVTGATIKKVFESSATAFDDHDTNGKFLQVSGE